MIFVGRVASDTGISDPPLVWIRTPVQRGPGVELIKTLQVVCRRKPRNRSGVWERIELAFVFLCELITENKLFDEALWREIVKFNIPGSFEDIKETLFWVSVGFHD